MANRTDVPEEIQDEYYEPERNERSGVAWLLAFGTLIITILLAAGIFFAGRWTYRQITGTNDSDDANISQEESSVSEADEQQANGGSDRQGAASGEGGDGSAQDRSSQEQVQGQSGDEEVAQSDTNDGSVAGDNTDDGEGQAGDESLPSTGPGNVAVVFIAMTFATYLLHRFYLSLGQK